MASVSEKTFKAIKERNINPQPKWQIVLRNHVFWALFGLSVIIGALAVSIVLLIISERDWDVYRYLDKSLAEYIMVSIPYLWLLIFILFALSSYYYFKNTSKGYRYDTPAVLIVSFSASILIGTMLFFGGIDLQIRDLMADNFPFYNKLVYTDEDVWNAAEKGLLGGEVTEIRGPDQFVLRDSNGTIWNIGMASTSWPGNLVFQRGLRVKMIGHPVEDHIFFANTIRSWSSR
jgi:hypothetical protein